ncbi:MAG TPA: hypothetical protein VKK31_29115 [Thermoanaerobaculia bacterium]|nr:hypothetical protein [Thermoanaerobaculia bacterium]
MLVLVALLVGLNTGFLTARRMHGADDRGERKKLDAILAEWMGDRDLRDFSEEEIEALGRKLSPVVRQILGRRLSSLAVPALFGLFLLTSATAIYLDHPRRFRRRHRSQPLREDEAPTVVRYLERCTGILGLPALEVEHRDGYGNEAQAFGLRSREVLLFHGAPDLLEKSWGDLSKAIALHEIGHVKNGDTQAPQQSKAVWAALTALLILAMGMWAWFFLLDLRRSYRTGGATAALSLLGDIGRSVPHLGWRMAAMLLLIRLIWVGLVRTRELYADRRVASWGSERTLDRMLRLPEPGNFWERSRWWEAAWSRWGELDGWERVARTADWMGRWIEPLYRPHPTNLIRREALKDPARLFRVSPVLSFVTGVLLSILTVNLIFPMAEIVSDASLGVSAKLWGDLAPGFVSIPPPWGKRLLLSIVAALNLGSTLLVLLLPLIMVSYLTAGTLGTQVQKEAVADLAMERSHAWGYGRLLRPAALLALGVEAGFFAAPFNTGQRFPSGVGLLILWLAGLTSFTWLWLVYVRALTRFTIGLHAGTSLPRKLGRVVNGAAVTLLAVLYWPAGFARLAFQDPLWDRLGRLAPRTDPRETFVYTFVMTGIILAVFAVVVYVIWAAVSLAVVAVRLRRWHVCCPSCGDPVDAGFALGRCCTSCGALLAAWAYAAPAFDPGSAVERSGP